MANFQPKKSYGSRIKSQEPCTNSLATRNSDLGPRTRVTVDVSLSALDFIEGVGLRMAGPFLLAWPRLFRNDLGAHKCVGQDRRNPRHIGHQHQEDKEHCKKW